MTLGFASDKLCIHRIHKIRAIITMWIVYNLYLFNLFTGYQTDVDRQ